LITQHAGALQGSEEPNPRVWNSISATVGEWGAEMDLISAEARLLQSSDEPSPRVWNSIQATLGQWQSEMNEVSEQARQLQDSEEPSPRVWNTLEIALRQEGLIRQPRQEDRLVAAGARRRWVWAWMAPVAAALLVVGTMVYERGDSPITHEMAIGQPPAVPALSEDQQLIEAVSSRAPAMRTTYENNLRDVNAYIHDAEQTVKDDPTDEEAQESLVNAYAQKSMLYEMALDRSLP
jgi:hypothetical protein